MMNDNQDKSMLTVPKIQGLQFTNFSSRNQSEDGDEALEDDGPGAMGYQQTLMYGRYSRSLGEELKEEMKRQKMLEKTHKREYMKIKTELR